MTELHVRHRKALTERVFRARLGGRREEYKRGARERARRWQEENPERYKAYQAAYRKLPYAREAKKIYQARYRAKLRAAA